MFFSFHWRFLFPPYFFKREKKCIFRQQTRTYKIEKKRTSLDVVQFKKLVQLFSLQTIGKICYNERKIIRCGLRKKNNKKVENTIRVFSLNVFLCFSFFFLINLQYSCRFISFIFCVVLSIFYWIFVILFLSMILIAFDIFNLFDWIK